MTWQQGQTLWEEFFGDPSHGLDFVGWVVERSGASRAHVKAYLFEWMYTSSSAHQRALLRAEMAALPRARDPLTNIMCTCTRPPFLWHEPLCQVSIWKDSES